MLFPSYSLLSTCNKKKRVEDSDTNSDPFWTLAYGHIDEHPAGGMFDRQAASALQEGVVESRALVYVSFFPSPFCMHIMSKRYYTLIGALIFRRPRAVARSTSLPFSCWKRRGGWAVLQWWQWFPHYYLKHVTSSSYPSSSGPSFPFPLVSSSRIRWRKLRKKHTLDLWSSKQNRRTLRWKISSWLRK